jgi:hypothetical protein
MSRAEAKRLGSIIGVCLLPVLIYAAVAPGGDVFLDDDSIYAEAVFRTYRDGLLSLHPMTTPTLILQVAAGWVWSLLFGYSGAALKFLTVLAGVSCLALLYGIAREVGLSHRDSVVCAAVLALNPLFIRLTPTFMTDVFFLALAYGAILALLKGLSGREFWFLIGGFLSAGAFFVRQIGIVIPICLCASVILLRNSPRRLRVSALVLAILPPFAAASAYWRFGEALGVMSWAQVHVVNRQLSVGNIFRVSALWGAAQFAAYDAVFVLPAVFIARSTRSMLLSAAKRRPMRVLAAALLAGGCAVFAAFDKTLTLNMGGIMGWMGLSRFPRPWEVTLYAALAVVLLLALASLGEWRQLFQTKQLNSKLLFPVLVACAFAVPFCVQPYFRTDRYVLPVFPLVTLALLHLTTRWTRPLEWAGVAALLVVGAASTVVVRAHFGIAQLQYQAADELVGQGVLPSRITGGFGWDVWHSWDACRELTQNDPALDRATYACWGKDSGPEWKVKVTRFLGVPVAVDDSSLAILRVRQVSVLGLRNEVTSMGRLSRDTISVQLGKLGPVTNSTNTRSLGSTTPLHR